MNFKLISAIYMGVLAGTEVMAQGGKIAVAPVSELQNAVAIANSQGGNTTILVQNGTYTLNNTLYANVPNVMITGESGDRSKVTIQGDA
jgi:hypothetical protein